MAKSSFNDRSRSAFAFEVVLQVAAVIALFGGLSTFAVTAQRTVVTEETNGLQGLAVPASVSGVDDNESAVHHIRTKTRYSDGYREERHGTGFVVGRRFITVYHNIDVLLSHGSYERSIQLGGINVHPSIVDVANDIAIFNLPDVLCATWCNESEPSVIAADLELSQPVGWFEFVSPKDARQWRQARIIEVMFKNYGGAAADTVCDSGVVVAVDKPFYPGSSGGPVWDLASNRLLGMVQGSFVRESGEQVGYYKPFSCVQSLLAGTNGSEKVEFAGTGRSL